VSGLAQYQTSATFAVNWSGSDAVSGIATYDVQYKDGAGGMWTDWLTATALTSSNFNGMTDIPITSRFALGSCRNVETTPAANGDTGTTVDATPPSSSVTGLAQYQTSATFAVKLERQRRRVRHCHLRRAV